MCKSPRERKPNMLMQTYACQIVTMSGAVIMEPGWHKRAYEDIGCAKLNYGL